MRLYGDSRSGNCLKVKWLLDALGRPYEWVEMNLAAGDTRTPEFLGINPWGQVSTAVLDDGRALTQSNALLLHFGEGSRFVPADPYDRAEMHAWMFWKQNSHEPFIAVRRYRLIYLRQTPGELDPALLTRGYAALARLEAAVTEHPFLLGDQPTLADLALIAYTRVASEGGLDLEPYAAVRQWIGRVETTFYFTGTA